MQKLWHDLYEAETLSDARRAVLSTVPQWVPWLGGGVCLIAYAAVLRTRLFLARWRRAARKRAERKFSGFRRWKGCDAPPPCVVITRIEEEVDGDEDGDGGSDAEGSRCGDGGAATTLSVGDIAEFRCSVGLRSPRDDDLLIMIEEMLLVDDVPDGWVLCRTTSGVVRFMNLNTQELCLFPPGRQGRGHYIRKELRRRNKLEIESGFSLSYNNDEVFNESWGGGGGHTGKFPINDSLGKTSETDSSLQRNHSRGTDRSTRDDAHFVSDEDTLSFSSDEADLYGEGERSAFRRVFRYFLEREKRRIERDVEMQFWSCDTNGDGTGKDDNVASAKVENCGLRLLVSNGSPGQNMRDIVSRPNGCD
ncbi:uncharacterized protein TEOVI_000624900 [Trypanosoma equiperdum]|uniref:Uncharacterized protein n=1 Tax=Trypanosoma equiperdum TaxID=5694 RepID=A0A1G4I2P3_TRYEQ|nr:hypothetical protein, conserved [Trypanosoma equiperdum]